jgi:hypothetical protein
LNITEILSLSILETGVRHKFPSPTSLKQFEGVLLEGLYTIPLETVGYCKKECGCIEGKRWSNSILIKKSEQY